MSYLIQIGAGAGDQDELVDGFTKFVKKKINYQSNKIIIIEANPLNLDKLKICWKEFSNVKIFNLAIVDNNFKNENIKIFYTLDDGPNYQVTSIHKDHVKKHYPNSEIIETNVDTKKINDFLKDEVGLEKIEYLAIDAEGIDFDIVMDLDLKKFNIKNISIEYIHLDRQKIIKLFNKFLNNGYSYIGKGFDTNGYDLMFKKKMNIFLRLKTKFKLYKLARKRR